MDPTIAQDLPGILTITFLFGGIALYAIVNTVASNWRKARVAEQNAVLKKAMIDRGFSAAEIVAVLSDGGKKACKMAGKPPEPAHRA